MGAEQGVRDVAGSARTVMAILDMTGMVERSAGLGLERPSNDAGRCRPDRVVGIGPVAGVELVEAWFGGRAHARHRHDTYAIGVTDAGVQAFGYRGAACVGTPGQVVVLHPDEAHDGGAGTPDGIGYRMVHVEPSRIAAAALAIRGHAVPLPFLREAVSGNAVFHAAVDGAFAAFPAPPEPLAVDAARRRHVSPANRATSARAAAVASGGREWRRA